MPTEKIKGSVGLGTLLLYGEPGKNKMVVQDKPANATFYRGFIKCCAFVKGLHTLLSLILAKTPFDYPKFTLRNEDPGRLMNVPKFSK